MSIFFNDNAVTLCLEGQLDSSNAASLERAALEAVNAVSGARIIIDAQKLTYISSAGLRVLLRLRKQAGYSISIRDVSPEVYSILETTGFNQLFDIQRHIREVTVEGCEVIGRGAYGTVYRVDPDTVVKVYEVPDAFEMVKNEQRMAKRALLMGIPTPISYDVVRVGAWYGSVFEMVKAKTLNELLIEQPEKAEEYFRMHAGIMRQVHGVEMPPGELPDARHTYMSYLEAIRPILHDTTIALLRKCLEDMPEDLHLIHGDFHMKNVMLCGEEPMLIDMETLSVGDPVFDFAGLIIAYDLFNEDEPENSIRFLDMPAERSRPIWRHLLKCYFDHADDDTLDVIADRAMALACLRFLYLLYAMNAGTESFKALRIRKTTDRLNALLLHVSSFSVSAYAGKV